MQYALNTPTTKFCKGDLPMFNWPKYEVKRDKMKINYIMFD